MTEDPVEWLDARMAKIFSRFWEEQDDDEDIFLSRSHENK